MRPYSNPSRSPFGRVRNPAAAVVVNPYCSVGLLLIVCYSIADAAGHLLLGLRAFLLLLLLRPVLRALRGFLAAIGLIVHAVPAFFSSRGAGKGEQCPHLTGTGIVLVCHKLMARLMRCLLYEGDFRSFQLAGESLIHMPKDRLASTPHPSIIDGRIKLCRCSPM